MHSYIFVRIGVRGSPLRDICSSACLATGQAYSIKYSRAVVIAAVAHGYGWIEYWMDYWMEYWVDCWMVYWMEYWMEYQIECWIEYWMEYWIEYLVG